MKLAYDPKTDILHITFGERQVTTTNEAEAGVVLGYDSLGRLISLEIPAASQRMANQPWSIEIDTKPIPTPPLDWNTASAEEIIAVIRANRYDRALDVEE